MQTAYNGNSGNLDQSGIYYTPYFPEKSDQSKISISTHSDKEVVELFYDITYGNFNTKVETQKKEETCLGPYRIDE